MRESTEEQGANSGPEAQRQGIEQFCEQYGMTLGTDPDAARAEFERILPTLTKEDGGFDGAVYIDLVSGSGHKERPQFEKMLLHAAAEPRQFDVLVVYDSTRIGRNMDKVGGWTDQLHEAGVAIAYVYDRLLSSDPSTGSLVSRAVGAAMSEDYRRKLADKVRDGYRVRRFGRGKWSGTPPIGYRMHYEERWSATKQANEAVESGTLVPDHRERLREDGTIYTNVEVVTLIGEMYATGQYGTRALAAFLNAEGYRTVAGRPFTGGSIRHIVENAVYNGWTTRHARKDKQRRYRGEGPHEPIRTHKELAIWSDELWAAITTVRQRLGKGVNGGRVKNTYPFRRKVVCDRCMAWMYGEAHSHKGDPAPLLGYGCITARERHGCDQGFIANSVIEAFVSGLLAGVSARDLDLGSVADALQVEAAPPPRPADVDRIERQIERLKFQHRHGLIEDAEFVRETRALKTQREATMPVRGTSEDELRRAAAQLDDLGRLWADGTPEERAQLVDMFIDHIRVHDHEVVPGGLRFRDARFAVAFAARALADEPELLVRPRTDSNRRRQP
jgi:DNA invertase Pin-like site-specific DNA recombinase